jgi:Protein of unknown function (DUF2844)
MSKRLPKAFSRLTLSISLSLALATIGAPALAALGGNFSSVQTDRTRLAARLVSTAAGPCTLHALTLQNGAVTEYARADGLIFAVTWRGPARANLRQLLGGYFDTLQADNAVPGGRRLRRPLAVNRADFAVRTGGHSGAFWGVAVLPQSAPSGCAVNPLQ